MAPATIHQRLSTVCRLYRFANIEGRIGSNPAQYVRRPKVHRSQARGVDRFELGRILFAAEPFDRAHAALAALLGLIGLRVSETCSAKIEDLALERGTSHRRQGEHACRHPLVPRTARTLGLAVGERMCGPITVRRDGQALDRRTAHRWVRAISKRAGLGLVHPHMLRSAFDTAALDAGVSLREVQIAARHADPRTITVYDHRRQDLDKHAAYVIVAFVTGGRPTTSQFARSRECLRK